MIHPTYLIFSMNMFIFPPKEECSTTRRDSIDATLCPYQKSFPKASRLSMDPILVK